MLIGSSKNIMSYQSHPRSVLTEDPGQRPPQLLRAAGPTPPDFSPAPNWPSPHMYHPTAQLVRRAEIQCHLSDCCSPGLEFGSHLFFLNKEAGFGFFFKIYFLGYIRSFFFCFYYLCLRWVFTAVRGLSLLRQAEDALCCGSQVSHCSGFFC